MTPCQAVWRDFTAAKSESELALSLALKKPEMVGTTVGGWIMPIKHKAASIPLCGIALGFTKLAHQEILQSSRSERIYWETSF